MIKLIILNSCNIAKLCSKILTCAPAGPGIPPSPTSPTSPSDPTGPSAPFGPDGPDGPYHRLSNLIINMF